MNSNQFPKKSNKYGIITMFVVALVSIGLWIDYSQAQSFTKTVEREAPTVSSAAFGDKKLEKNSALEIFNEKQAAHRAPRGTYVNTYGNEVPRPYYSDTKPIGASAKCNDGTYSFSQSRRGTCSHHGGVLRWY